MIVTLSYIWWVDRPGLKGGVESWWQENVAVMGTGFWHGEIWGQIPNLLGEENGTSLQYSCLENPMDWGAWWATVHRFAKSPRQLNDFSFTHWRRQWQPTPVFLPGESQGWGSLVGCHLGVTQSRTRLSDFTFTLFSPNLLDIQPSNL